ncbi:MULTISPECIES: LysR family transcriptional regulator [Dyella]|uniref:LysR family transcriptional regulator n=1 Tax=Dyella TaxID=231454 RepID=UPI0013F1480A|nr:MULTISPECIES: LysR family transcriptional regulator [Dyella]
MNIELRYLHAFRAVCDAGSLRAGAAQLHRTEQAVSYQLRRLEESLGTPLFDRLSGRLVPNAAGQRLLAFCRDMGRDWARVRDELQEAQAPAATLRIAAVSGFGRYDLLPLFRDGPLSDLPLRMSYPTADEVVRMVESGEADLGFVHRMPPPGRHQLLAVGSEEIVLVAGAVVGLPDDVASILAQAPYITYDESDFVFATWFTQMIGTSPGSIQGVAHFEELEEVLDWVAAGRGVSVVPGGCARDPVEQGTLRVVGVAGRSCRNTIYAVVDPASRHPATDRTLQAVRERLGT